MKFKNIGHVETISPMIYFPAYVRVEQNTCNQNEKLEQTVAAVVATDAFLALKFFLTFF